VTDPAEIPAAQTPAVETPVGQPVSAGAPAPSAATPSGPDGGAAAVVQQRPEAAVGAAFAGGLVLALILKRLAR
jgi:hypothetical protein